MSVDRINIGNSININFIESDKFKTNHIGIDFICELNEKTASKNALLLKVLKRGSKNYPTMTEINKKLKYLYRASIGAKLNKIGEVQIFGLSIDVIDDKYALENSNAGILKETVKLAGDILMNPLLTDGEFKSEYVDTEKVNLINDIKGLINNKIQYAMTKCNEIMCEGEKFAVNNSGKIENVDAINGKNLYEHYLNILDTAAIEIYFVGNVKDNKDSLLEEFKNIFKNLNRSDIQQPETEIRKTADYKGETIEEMEVNQGKLAIGFRIGTSSAEPDYPAFVLFNALYGASTTSKLFMNVREKLSLCYYCSSAAEAHKGIMTVNCGVEVENKQKAQDEILKQLEDVKNGNFSEKELEDARRSVINRYNSVYDDAWDVEYWYLARKLCGVEKTPDEFISLIKPLTAGDVINAAKQISLDTVYFLKGTITGGAENE